MQTLSLRRGITAIVNPGGAENMDKGRNYRDLQQHIDELKARGLLYVIDEPVNKDTEMVPLVRWQFRGGLRESDRKAFLFKRPTDAAGRSYASNSR